MSWAVACGRMIDRENVALTLFRGKTRQTHYPLQRHRMAIDGIPQNSITGTQAPLTGSGSKLPGKAGPEREELPAVKGDDVRFSSGSMIVEPEVKQTADKEAPEAPVVTSFQVREAPPTTIATLEEAATESSAVPQCLFSRIGGALSKFGHKIIGEGDIYRYGDMSLEINSLEATMARLTDKDLQAKTGEFRDRIKSLQASGKTLEESLNAILPEAFAAMREADKRVLKMRPFDEQVQAGIAAHEGTIVEQKTGEGKTLMETLPVYLNALSGNGVHVVTVNEYLARRDAEWMGKALAFMGLSVGVIGHDMPHNERIAANKADVTYGTNDEFGFQYLQDNLVHEKEARVSRDLKNVYALVDEVDNILIDEARTPLIISRKSKEEQPPYKLFAELAHHLQEGTDYKVDRKEHTTTLTEKGLNRAEKMLGVDNLYAEENMHMVSFVRNAITAKALYTPDVDYVVTDGQVTIVDEFTGRLMPGRRYSEGLHEAIEAKENVPVKEGTETLAMITFQNYFSLYGKMAGMTGTAETAKREFAQVFGKKVVVIPTHKPVIRDDKADLVFRTEKEKFEAVARQIKELHDKGQPILVGTISIEKSELLSSMLKSMGIPHNVLNAKNHSQEADIIAQAGRFGAVTVATNMAGRGTDIKLGGDAEKLAKKESESGKISYKEALEKYQKICDADKAAVKELGGLAVIGTERHEDERVDNQLRGRSGRQGDPGMSQFFISLEDELIRLFAGDRLKRLVGSMGLPYGQPIQSGFVNKAIKSAQKKCEDRNLDIRMNLMRYDGVMNAQREAVYSDRDAVLEGEDLHDMVINMIEMSVNSVIEKATDGEKKLNADMSSRIDQDLSFLFSSHGGILGGKKFKTVDELRKFAISYGQDAYRAKEGRIGKETMDILQREVFLSILDENWVDQQTMLKDLREGIWMRAYGQQDPDQAYFHDAHEMYESHQNSVALETVRTLFSLPAGAKKN
jgi:preprotein translocase subunit SecA